MQSDVVKDALILAALAGVAAACFKLVGLSSVVIQYLRVSKPVINGVISGVGTGRRFINGFFAATSMVTSFPAAVLGIKLKRRRPKEGDKDVNVDAIVQVDATVQAA